jgi:type IV pilus assembly protein PilW
MPRLPSSPRTPLASRRHTQLGVSMVELMVALLLGLFLMGGLVGLVQSNKRAFGSQNELSQLQDAERLAMTMMNDVVEQAGYFPDPTVNTQTSALPAAGAFAVGQSLTGTYSAAAPGDTLSVRYTTATGDGILNCAGSSNTTGANATYTNTFSVVVTGGVGQLVCTRETGTSYVLVNNVTNLSVLYGVDTAGSGDNVDTYMTAAQVTAAGDWNSVMSAQVSLTFNNPLYSAPGQPVVPGQPPFITIKRNINIMKQTG